MPLKIVMAMDIKDNTNLDSLGIDYNTDRVYDNSSYTYDGHVDGDEPEDINTDLRLEIDRR